jgi:osmotically inducible protein OsmC
MQELRKGPSMSTTSKVVHTARTRTKGGREYGASRSSDGRLDIRFATPNSDRIGTSPEHLLAAAWSACLESAVELAAHKSKVRLPAGVDIEAEVDLNTGHDGLYLSARFNIRVAGIDRETAQALVAKAHDICPYSKATRGNIDVALMLIY